MNPSEADKPVVLTQEPSERAGTEAVGRILAAAEELFARQGFDAVSMNAIAEAASVSKANIFHHFESKLALYLAVVRHACADTAERLQQLRSDGGAVAERLADFAENHLKSLLEHDRVSRLILRELAGEQGAQRAQELAEQVFGQNFENLVEIVRAGQRGGDLRDDFDPAMLATLLIGANVFFFQSREVLRHFRDVNFTHQPAHYSRMLMDIFLRGIRAQPKTS